MSFAKPRPKSTCAPLLDDCLLRQNPGSVLTAFALFLKYSNVFIQVNVAVQYRVLQDGAYEAFYRLTDARGQIQSYVFDVVRSTVPKLELDEAFASKDEIAEAVLQQLQDVMKNYGYEIKNTLVTDLAPDARVKVSPNVQMY